MKKSCAKLTALSLVVVVMLVFTGCLRPVLFQIEYVDFAAIPNGIFTGYANNGIVQARVSVTVVDGVVTDIAILEHRQGRGRRAEAITVDVIDAQSLDVDVIASATYSSSTILKAIENALRQQIEE